MYEGARHAVTSVLHFPADFLDTADGMLPARMTVLMRVHHELFSI